MNPLWPAVLQSPAGLLFRRNTMFAKAPIVETAYGKVIGIEVNGHYSYRGIRYAKPPVDELRFAPPQPLDAWEGIYDAAL